MPQSHLKGEETGVFIHQLLSITVWGLISGKNLVAQMVKNLPTVQETWVQSPGWEGPLEKRMATHSVLLPGESHGGYSPWDCKESDMTE